MLKQVADGVFVHESEFIQTNSTVVQGPDGVLLVDPGITRSELTALAADIRALGLPVVAGFSTHPDWDHVLWHSAFGDVPRFGTARNAAAMRELLAQANWESLVAGVLPPEHADDIPMELLGLITALPAGATEIPWDGPTARILEHQGHAAGHAALLIEERGVLIAGDMLSDILMPFLDLDAAEPLEDYLVALDLFDTIAEKVEVVVPGHGSVGNSTDLTTRIAQDRAYVRAAQDGREIDDVRVGPAAPLYWLPDIHAFQLQRLAEKTAQDRARL